MLLLDALNIWNNRKHLKIEVLAILVLVAIILNVKILMIKDTVALVFLLIVVTLIPVDANQNVLMITNAYLNSVVLVNSVEILVLESVVVMQNVLLPIIFQFVNANLAWLVIHLKLVEKMTLLPLKILAHQVPAVLTLYVE